MVGRHNKVNTSIDWPVVLVEARAAGLSIQQLADHLGVHRNQVVTKELITGVKLKRLIEKPEKHAKPLYDWTAVLSEACDRGLNASQIADLLSVSPKAVRLAQLRTGIALPKGKPGPRLS